MRNLVDYVELINPSFPRTLFSKYADHLCHTLEDAHHIIREHGELRETKRMWSGHPAITCIRAMTEEQLPENIKDVKSKKVK